MSSPQMLDDSDPALPRGMVVTTRILWGALILGQLTTAIVLATLTAKGQSPKGPHPGESVMGLIAGAMLLGAAAVTFVVRRFFRFENLGSEAGIRARYTKRTIIPMAALEAAGFAGMIFVYLLGKWMPIGIVPVIAIVIQFALFPRRRLPGSAHS